VGSWYGFSTILMAGVAERVHAVDWHRGDPHAGERETLTAIWSNLAEAGLRDKVVLHVGRTEDVLPVLRPASFTFAFIDGYHTTEAVAHDAQLVLPLLRPGALLAFHDYGRFGVTRAVDALKLKVHARAGSLRVLQT